MHSSFIGSVRALWILRTFPFVSHIHVVSNIESVNAGMQHISRCIRLVFSAMILFGDVLFVSDTLNNTMVVMKSIRLPWSTSEIYREFCVLIIYKTRNRIIHILFETNAFLSVGNGCILLTAECTSIF